MVDRLGEFTEVLEGCRSGGTATVDPIAALSSTSSSYDSSSEDVEGADDKAKATGSSGSSGDKGAEEGGSIKIIDLPGITGERVALAAAAAALPTCLLRAVCSIACQACLVPLVYRLCPAFLPPPLPHLPHPFFLPTLLPPTCRPLPAGHPRPHAAGARQRRTARGGPLPLSHPRQLPAHHGPQRGRQDQHPQVPVCAQAAVFAVFGSEKSGRSKLLMLLLLVLLSCCCCSCCCRTVAGLWNSGSGQILRHGQPMGRAEGEVRSGAEGGRHA